MKLFLCILLVLSFSFCICGNTNSIFHVLDNNRNNLAATNIDNKPDNKPKSKSNIFQFINNAKDSNRPQDIDWTQDKSLRLKKINIELVKSFRLGEDISKAWMQGMVITDRFLVVAQVAGDENNTVLSIADKNTFELLGKIDTYCFHHANDMAFNNDTGEVIIVAGEKNVARFKLLLISGKAVLTHLEYVNCARSYSGIAYDDKRNRYMAYSGGKMYVMDEHFRELYSFPLRTGLIPQGMTYKDNYIYYSCYENGRPNRKIYNSKERFSNLIYVYDLKGNLKKTLYIPRSVVPGEIESLDFTDNGELIMGYNIRINKKKTITFYKRALNLL